MFGLGKLFSPDKLIDTVSKGVDKVFYTDEERANTWERMVRLYEPFKLAQRYIALSLLFLLGGSWFIAVVVRLGGNMFATPLMMDGEVIRWWIDDSAWIATNALSLFGEPFFYAVVFYYAGGAGEGLVGKMMKGKDKLLNK